MVEVENAFKEKEQLLDSQLAQEKETNLHINSLLTEEKLNSAATILAKSNELEAVKIKLEAQKAD